LGKSSGTAKPSGATSNFSDAFQLSSASLPTEETSYGVEAITTFLTSGASPGIPNLALLKGFHRFGTGLSTSAGNTFYSNDLVQRLNGPAHLKTLVNPESAKGYVTNLNFGTSFLLLDPEYGPSVQLGLSGRYNRITNTLGGGPALLLGSSFISLGAGISHEKTSNNLSAQNFMSLLISARLEGLEVEFNFLDTVSHDYTAGQGVKLGPIKILTATYPIGDFVLTAAVRALNYESEGDVTQFHASIQYLLDSHLAIGYLFNYIPGGNSIGLQFYL
jgi:hypothetical protein